MLDGCRTMLPFAGWYCGSFRGKSAIGKQGNAFDATNRALPRFAPCRALLASFANAGENIPSTKKLGKNYYVVRKPNSGDCKVEPKKVPNDFIMVGKSPYASQKYAEAAIETFPECTSARKESKE